MLKRLFALSMLCLVFGVTQAFAQTPAEKAATAKTIKAEKEIEALKKRLQELYPASKLTSVRESPIEGLYELVAGKNLMYTDKSGKYFVFGSIMDMKTQHDLSADRREELNTIDLNTLPVADAIPLVRGKGTRKLYVFSDPECPFCKRAEESLKDVDDVTIYVFLMPIAQLHPTATKLSENIWCSDDKAKAWSDWMLLNIKPADKSCDNPLARNQSLAASMNIHGTPTFIREDGRLMSGAPSKGQVQNYLTPKE